MGIGIWLFCLFKAVRVPAGCRRHTGQSSDNLTRVTALPPLFTMFTNSAVVVLYRIHRQQTRRRARPAGPRHWARCHGGSTSRFTLHACLSSSRSRNCVTNSIQSSKNTLKRNTRSLATHSTHISRDRSHRLPGVSRCDTATWRRCNEATWRRCDKATWHRPVRGWWDPWGLPWGPGGGALDDVGQRVLEHLLYVGQRAVAGGEGRHDLTGVGRHLVRVRASG